MGWESLIESIKTYRNDNFVIYHWTGAPVFMSLSNLLRKYKRQSEWEASNF